MRMIAKRSLLLLMLLIAGIGLHQAAHANNSPCGVTCSGDTHYGLPCPAETSCGSCGCCGCTCEPPPADIVMYCTGGCGDSINMPWECYLAGDTYTCFDCGGQDPTGP